jgi:hypothetical protein
VLGFSCTYYYLYGQLRKQNSQLRETVAELNREREFLSQISGQLTFVHILNSWQKGHIDRVRSLSRLFDKDGREGAAVRFLLDDRPLRAKVGAFQDEMGRREPFFASFVIAEHHLRDGDNQAALGLLQQALGHADEKADGLLRVRAQDSIVDLTAAEKVKPRPGGSGE